MSLLLQGLVSQDMRRSLGHMSFNFLLPTLTFVNIAPQVDSQALRLWWPAAVNIIVRWASPDEAFKESMQLVKHICGLPNVLTSRHITRVASAGTGHTKPAVQVAACRCYGTEG